MRSGYHDDAALSPGAPETILLKEISGLDSDSELGLDHYLTMRGTTGGRSVPVQQLARKAGADPPHRLYKAMCTNKTNILFYTGHAACPIPTAGPYLQGMESAMRGRQWPGTEASVTCPGRRARTCHSPCAGTISASSWRRRAPRKTPGRLAGVAEAWDRAGPASAGANGSARIYLSTQADRKKRCEGGEGSRRDRESGARGSGSRRARGRGRASLHHRHEPCQCLAPWLMSRHSRDPGLPGNLTPEADDLPGSLADLDGR